MPPAPGGKIRHQPALDGLRAVAVGGVMAYHLGAGWAPGGFLGVDTFFVLSGYLITTLLLVEHARGGRIDLRAFWARRARRLLPALFLVLTAVAVWSALSLSSDQLGTVRGDGLATLFYGANWRLIVSGQSYFAALSLPSPLRHAWSLAIEEQFYLVWPLAVAALLALFRGRSRALGIVCAAGTIASASAMALVYDPLDSSRAYYGTDTRVQALLVGALLAVVLRRWSDRPDAGSARTGSVTRFARVRGVVRAGIGIAAACACLAAFVRVSDADTAMYHGGFTLFAVVVAVLVATTVVPGPSPVRRALSLRPVVWIGTISYGLYLWHWPVQVALTASRTGVDGAMLDVLRVGATFALATLSYYVVERPVRRGVLGPRWRRVLAPVIAAGVGGILLVSTAGAAAPPAYLRNEGSAGIDRALAGLRSAPAGATSTTVAPSTTSTTAPPPTTAVPTPPVTLVPPRRLLAVGDSVLASLAPALRADAGARGLVFRSVAIPGCGVFTGEPVDPNDQRLSWAAACGNGMAHLQLDAVQQFRPDVVVWLSTWETADRIVDGTLVRMDSPEGVDMTMRLIDEAVARLTSTGARVALVTVAPNTWSPDTGDPTPEATSRVQLLDSLLQSYASEHPDRAFVVPLDRVVCPAGPPCPQVVSGIQLRIRDGKHYAAAGAAWLAPWILDRILTPPATPGA